MRLYGKRFMANRTEGRISDRKESRDSVVYDISEANRYCRVRVAGSDTLVRAWFPNNFMRSPQWLKVGTAVRIAHVGGSKSRIEVVSPGLVQPTQATIPMSGGVNTVLLGMYPTAPVESAEWNVSISSGTYRINGVSYMFNPSGMVLGGDVALGSDATLGDGSYLHAIDPIANDDPDELWFRYDAFVIGNDGVVDYLKGDEWQFTNDPYTTPTGPEKPAIPTGHLLIRNYVLVYSGTESITQANIGKEWEAPRPDHLDVTYGYADPYYETDDGWARSQEGVGVIKGAPNTYQPASPGGHSRGSISQDMNASVSVQVMTQYNTPHSWWSSGSVNQLEIKKIGSAGYDGYGAVGTGLGGPGPVPDLTDESGSGVPATVSLGLGSSYSFSYVRKSSYVAQPDPDADGYPGYYQGDSDSHTAVLQVSLVSPDAVHPVSAIIVFYCLDAAGNPQ